MKNPKSKRFLINAFIELRSQKELEQIKVTELCNKADVNKSTFYEYFNDIYDLSDQLETETVDRIIQTMENPRSILEDQATFTRDFILGFKSNENMIKILFSGCRSYALPEKFEKSVKNLLFEYKPELKNDPEINILITYKIYGSFYAYIKNTKYDDSVRIKVMSELARF